MKRPVLVLMLALIFGELIAVAKVEFIAYVIIIPLFLVQKIIAGKVNAFPLVIFFVVILGMNLIGCEEKKSDVAASLNLKNVTVEGEYKNYRETESFYWYYLKNVKITSENQYYHMDNIVVKSTKLHEFKIGNKVKTKGSACLFESATNYGNFDSRNYYKSCGIYLYVKEKSTETVSTRYNILLEGIHKLRMEVAEILSEICDDENESVFLAIIIGDKENLSENIKNMYQTNGISHLLAVSGLHISTIGMMIYNLIRGRFKFVVSAITSFVVVMGFMFLSGGAISCVRATIMYCVFLMSQIAGRRYDALNALSFAGIILVFDNPYVILNSAFQMSFGAILSIYIVYPSIRDYLDINVKNKKTSLRKKDVKIIILDVFSSFKGKFIQSLLVSVSVNITLLPVILYNYFEIPWLGTILNVIVIPMMSLVLCAALLSVISYFLVSIVSIYGANLISSVVIIPGRIILELYEHLCCVFSAIPYNLLVLGRPTDISIVIYYVLILAFILYVNKKRQRAKLDKKYIENKPIIIKYWKRKVYKIICFIFGVFFLCTVVRAPRDNKLYIVANDVGQGECLLLYDKQQTVMIDCGSTSEHDIFIYKISSTLKARGIDRIDYFFVTHCDEDHISGLLEMLTEEKHNNVKVANVVFSRNVIRDQSFLELYDILKQKNINIIFLERNNCFDFDKLKIKCIFPEKEFLEKNKNEMSLVLEITYLNYKMLFTGDISEQVEERLINRGLGKYDFLKVAHHGSKLSTSETFLNVVQPKLAVISCGKNNMYGHPAPEVIEKLNKIGCKYMRTDESGGITLSTDGENVFIHP